MQKLISLLLAAVLVCASWMGAAAPAAASMDGYIQRLVEAGVDFVEKGNSVIILSPKYLVPAREGKYLVPVSEEEGLLEGKYIVPVPDWDSLSDKYLVPVAREGKYLVPVSEEEGLLEGKYLIPVPDYLLEGKYLIPVPDDLLEGKYLIPVPDYLLEGKYLIPVPEGARGEVGEGKYLIPVPEGAREEKNWCKEEGGSQEAGMGVTSVCNFN